MAAPESLAAPATPAGALVKEFRAAFVVAETNAPLLAANAELAEQKAYLKLFDDCRKVPDARGLFELPWKAGRAASFWERYLEAKPAAIDPWKAWKKFVPLRRPPRMTVGADWFKGNVSLAGYCYPFGQTLVLSVTASLGKTGKPLDEVAKLGIELRRREYRVQVGSVVQHLPMPQLIDFALERMRLTNRTEPLSPGFVSDRFSVLTVIRGAGFVMPDPVPNPPVDPAIQRILWAFCSGSTTYEKDTLSAFDTAAIGLKDSSPRHHVLYSSDRGRAVWFPVRFQSEEEEQRRHALGVYHRNLVACSMQVESLCGFLSAAGRLAAAKALPPAAFPAVRLAVGALNRLYKGSETYRTRSVQNQIVQRKGFVDELNAARRAILWPAGDFKP